MNFIVVRVLPVGTSREVIGRNRENTWLRIDEGWISNSSSLIRLSGLTTHLPFPTDEPTITPTFTPLPTTRIDPTPTRENLGRRISYNVNGGAVPDVVYLRDHLQRLCPSTVLVMDSLSLASDLYYDLRSCNTLVIHRNYSTLEGDEWVYRSPANFVQSWVAESRPHLIRYTTNEPSFGGQFSTASFVAHTVETMRLARMTGITLVVGNFGVGIVRPEDIDAGVYDPLIRALADYDHYLGLHEYSCCVLAFGVGQWPVSRLLDRNLVGLDSWPTAAQLPTRRTLVDGISQLPSYWYLRRGDWFLLRADAIGVERPQIILTEFGWDGLGNIKSQIEPLRRFGIDRYFRDMRGVNTYVNLWSWYWPDWSFSQAACAQLRWAELIYPREYIGFDLFTWSVNPFWFQTDFSGRENGAHFELHRCLENLS
jgi:hypothetical protein